MLKKTNINLFITLLTCLVICLPTAVFSGCAASTASELASRIFVLTENREYPRIYQYITASAQQSATLNEFTARYESIYTAMGVESLRLSERDLVETAPGQCTVTYTQTYTTSLFGEITFDMQMLLVEEEGAWKLEWTPAQILPGMDVGDTARIYQLTEERGEIFDANGELLAKNDYALSVYVMVSKIKNLEDFKRMAAPLLQMTEDDLHKKLSRYFPEESGEDESVLFPTPTPMPTPDYSEEEPYESTEDGRTVFLRSYKPDELTDDRRAELSDIPGIGFDSGYFTPVRTYPHGRLLSHTLGYMGNLSEESAQLPENQGLTTDSKVGQSGLERAYEQYLRGKPGYELSIEDKYGRHKETLAETPKQDGYDLRLTIDAELQQKAQLLLMEHLTDEMSGSVIVMDPSTGYIEADVSFPDYDPNQFSYGIDDETWAFLTAPENKLPLYNRSVQGLYPPGSTIKPFTGIMGLDSGAVTVDFAFNEPIDRNVWTPTIDGWVYPGIRRVSATQGYLNLHNALINSDNIYFAYVALKMGSDKFIEYAQRIGFDQAMDYDLALSTPKISNDETITSLRQLADSGYGQGEMLITPMQMAALFASLYNDGDMLIPRLVRSINTTNGPHYDIVQDFPPEVWRNQVVEKKWVDIVQPMLRKVVSQGTGRQAEVAGLGICGKTGTAQIGNDATREIAWFIGFTTDWHHPRLVCITLETPEGEGQARFTIAKALFEDLKTSYPVNDNDDTP